VVVFLQVLLKLVQREMSSIDKTSWFNWPGFAAFAQRAAAKPPTSEPTVADVTAAYTADSAADVESKPNDASTAPPPADGNGRSGNAARPSGGQPQHHGKKRKK
jgi:hypothetical protein